MKYTLIIRVKDHWRIFNHLGDDVIRVECLPFDPEVEPHPEAREFSRQKDAVEWAQGQGRENVRGMFDCIYCGAQNNDSMHMVHKPVWQAADFGRGTAHLGCLAKALGRPLAVEDFPLDVPLNAGILFGLQLSTEPSTRTIPC
jgi:hypothetical protein